MDYRQLNAITVKGKYHIPVVDELFNKLHHATWFFNLDLCVGFHQIRMDFSKQLFRPIMITMNLVLCLWTDRYPHSFQKAMNSSLTPLLRICVLVFFYDIFVYRVMC
jgi:hypothetical protein